MFSYSRIQTEFKTKKSNKKLVKFAPGPENYIG